MFDVKTLTLIEWEKYEMGGSMDIFLTPSYLKILQRNYEGDILIYVLTKKDKVLAIIGGLSRLKTFYFPHHFLYSPYYEEPAMSEIDRIDGLIKLLKVIKNRHHFISLRIPQIHKDIRPFTWEGFTYTLKFTYFKKLTNRLFHVNIQRILKKDLDVQYKFKVERDFEKVNSFLESDLKHYNIRKLKNLMRYFVDLHNNGLTLIVSVYKNEELKACNLILINKLKSEAHFFLISKVDEEGYKNQLPTFMYEYCFQLLEDMGIKYADLFGANIESIAKFKSKFLAELVCFYEVKYSKRKQIYNNLMFKIKQIIKRVLSQ